MLITYVFLCPSSNGAEVNCNQQNPLFYAYLLNFHVGIAAQKISFSLSITLRLETHCHTPFFLFFLSVFCPDGAEGIYPHGQPGWLDWMRHSVKRWGWSLIPNSWSRLLSTDRFIQTPEVTKNWSRIESSGVRNGCNWLLRSSPRLLCLLLLFLLLLINQAEEAIKGNGGGDKIK